MSPVNLTHSVLLICKILTFEVDEKDFHPKPKGDIKVLEAKNTISLE
jgi:hypothetical protein